MGIMILPDFMKGLLSEEIKAPLMLTCMDLAVERAGPEAGAARRTLGSSNKEIMQIRSIFLSIEDPSLPVICIH
ncbi:hypothetical protein NSS64_27120 [Paenibacillus sp. FSL H8-0122]|uniref:hypothetical protein n=1 Tax=Paenibacillus sp. FSL H8-0122 TaxID=2954510 RepID=UPI0030F578E5